MKKDPEIPRAVLDEARLAGGGDRHFDSFLSALEVDLPNVGESTARHVAERLVLALPASLMIRYAGNLESDAFCATRLGPDTYHSFGAGFVELEAISGRA